MDSADASVASSEQTICSLRLELRERVKELDCLHRMAALIHSSNTLVQVLQGTAELIPHALQYPENACARIVHRDQEFRTPNFRVTRCVHSEDLFVFQRVDGRIEVGYLTEPLSGPPLSFSGEERVLLRTIAERLETVIERFRVMEALGHGFHFANSALDALSAHVAILDENGTILFVNEMWRRFAKENHPEPDALCEGANYLEVCSRVQGEDRALAAEFAAGILAVARCEQDSFSLEYPARTHSEGRWYSGRVTRFSGDGPIRIVVAHEDITVRRSAEQALRESETKLRTIFENSRDAIGVSRLGIHVFVNPAYVTMFGYSSPDELIGVPILNLIAPSDHSRIIENIRRRDAGEPAPLAYETRGLRKDGTEFEIGVCVSTYELHEERNTLVILRDVTEQKRADEALRSSREQYRALVDDMPALVCRFQPNGVLTSVNNSASQYMGLPIKNLIHTSILAFLRPEDQAGFRSQLDTLSVENPIATFTCPFPGFDDGTRWLRWTTRALCDAQGIVTEFQTLGEDITKDVQAQEALRKAKEEAVQAREREEQRYQEAERRREIAEGLGDVLAELNSGQPLNSILDSILQQAGKLLGSRASVIYRYHDNQGCPLEAVEELADVPIGEPDLAWGRQALLQAIENRQAVMINDILAIEQDKRVAGDREDEHAFQSVLAVPIIVQDKAYGGLVLFYSSAQNFRADEVELALIQSHQVALAIENARLHEEAERAAVAAERTRLARDLHDAVTQTLFSASIMAEALPRVWEQDPKEGLRGLEELQHLTRGALAEMRTLLLELRPAGITEKPLGVILQQLVDAVSSRTRLPISLAVKGETCLSSDVQIAFYRIAQEALNNIAKHAHASHAWVRVTCKNGYADLEIGDNGQGFDASKRTPGKRGMGTMYERASSIHAVLRITSQPGHGTCVSIRRDLSEEEQD